jgi:hypothetical protein
MAITGTDIISFFSHGVWPKMQEIVTAPYHHSEILWTILPLVITTFMIDLYFGRHKTEELGWNTAFGNTISLLWVTTALFRFMYEEYGSWVFTTWDPTGHTPTVILVMVIACWAFLLAIFNYYHILPKAVSFVMSSAVPVNISALLAVIIVIGKVGVSWNSIIAGFIIFIALAILLGVIKGIVKPSKEAEEYIEEYKTHAAEMKQERERAFHHRVVMGKNRIKAQYHATIVQIKHFFGIKKQ